MRRRIAIVVTLLSVATVAVVATLGGTWVGSWFGGSGVRWRDAYRALEAAETNLPRDAKQRERLLLADAMVNGEPPGGVVPGPRLHRAGTLARLRYQTFDAQGMPLDDWQVRALVPPLPVLDGQPLNARAPLLGEHGCPDECRAALARSGGLLLLRTGDPGIAPEWVLRMPVNRTYDLGRRSLVTHDILSETPRQLGVTSRREGNTDISEPAHIRVTLLEACQADVRLGTSSRLEVYPFAIIPIPQGFRTFRWVQLDGCGSAAPFPEPAVAAPAPEKPVAAARAVDAPAVEAGRAVESSSPADPYALDAEHGSVVGARDPKTGFGVLQVDEAWLARRGRPTIFVVVGMCRFDPGERRWTRIEMPPPRGTTRIAPLAADQMRLGPRVAWRLPEETGLFQVTWTEGEAEGPLARSGRARAQRTGIIASGPVLCNDVALGTPPAGQIAACVPFADRAEARFVPDPHECGR
jgi:hypothetical protein